jgi:hypothetical protein
VFDCIPHLRLHVRIPTTSYRDLWSAVLLPSPSYLPPSPHLALPWPSPRLACTPNLFPPTACFIAYPARLCLYFGRAALVHRMPPCSSLVTHPIPITTHAHHHYNLLPRPPTSNTPLDCPHRPSSLFLPFFLYIRAISRPQLRRRQSPGFSSCCIVDIPYRSASPSHQASTRPPSSYTSDGTTGDIVQPSASPCTLLILKHFAA